MIAQADAIRVPLPNESVHCIVTSPPYHGLRRYSGEQGDAPLGLEKDPAEHIRRMGEVGRELWRILRSDGVLWWNYADAFVDGNLSGMAWKIIFAFQEQGWILRNDCIWQKRNPMPESVNGWRWQRERIKSDEIYQHDTKTWAVEKGDNSGAQTSRERSLWVDDPDGDLELRKGSWRHTRAHEYVFMLVKDMQYWSNQEAVRETLALPAAADGSRVFGGTLKHGANISHGERTTGRTYDSAPAGRNPRSVLDVTEQRHYELPDGTVCIVSEDCPVHGHQQSVQIQQMELDGEQATLPLSHNEGIDGRDPEPASESLSSSGHSSQEHRPPKKDSRNRESEPERNFENTDASKRAMSDSSADAEDAQTPSDNKNIQASTTYPSEDAPRDSDDPVAIDPNKRHRKKNALSDELDMASGPEALPRIDRNGSACSCRWIIPRAHYAPSVLDVPTAPYSGAHYATFPPNLIAPLIRATCPRWACPVCGDGWAAVVDVQKGERNIEEERRISAELTGRSDGKTIPAGGGNERWDKKSVLGYRKTCEHEHTQEEAVPGIVFDPFVGSGTTVAVAKSLLRRGIGIDVSMEYLDQQAKIRAGLGTPSNALEDLPLFSNLLE